MYNPLHLIAAFLWPSDTATKEASPADLERSRTSPSVHGEHDDAALNTNLPPVLPSNVPEHHDESQGAENGGGGAPSNQPDEDWARPIPLVESVTRQEGLPNSDQNLLNQEVERSVRVPSPAIFVPPPQPPPPPLFYSGLNPDNTGDSHSMVHTTSAESGDEASPNSEGIPKGQVNGRLRGVRRTCNCSDKGRNLVVCIDGTSNEFGDKNTNVIELYSLVRKGKDVKQLTYYNSGVGTYAGPARRSLAKVINQKLDLAIAWNFEGIVLDAYRWLSETYDDGDRIFLFGFSRGAYQVRVLSAMISKVGLLDKGNEKQIPFAYKWYTSPDSESVISETNSSILVKPMEPMLAKSPEPVMSASNSPLGSSKGTSSKIQSASRFKEVFSRDVQVHFVGAWDTVSSVGIVRGRKLLPGTAEGMDHVCYFRHALALDERRIKFLPEYACGGAGPSPRPKTHAQKRFSDTKEVWFAGTHSDVGGGNVKNENLDSARPALRWMYAEASDAGLNFDPFKREREFGDNEPEGDINVHESLTGFWWLLEHLPLQHLTYNSTKDGKGKETTRRLHRGRARVIQEGQKIHPSVWLSDDLLTTYIPRARLHGSSDGKLSEAEFWRKMDFWRVMKGRQDLEPDGTATNPWKEVDIYEVISRLVKEYAIIGDKTEPLNEKIENKLLEGMRTHASSTEGLRALYREVQQLLRGKRLMRPSSLVKLLEVLVKNSRPNEPVGSLRYKYRNLRPLVLRHLVGEEKDDKIARPAHEFLVKLTDTVQVLTGHTGPVTTVAFSANGTRVSSGSSDGTIRIWDAETGKLVGKPLEDLTGSVLSVAFSQDGKRLASGSEDSTIRIWDLETMQMVAKLEGHMDWVRSVAFSLDGRRIVSGSDDYTVRVWDTETGLVVGSPYFGHEHWVCSVAFSPDSKRVVSGSYDETVRVWDVDQKGGVPVKVFPVIGHHPHVNSVAFFPDGDGKRIVSGSDDGTIRLWDVETGGTVLELVRSSKRHRRAISSIAISANGEYIVSGSHQLVIWDTKMGKMMGKPYKGHSSGVTSVACLSDGTRMVSGSDDRTVRIWDILREPV